MAPYRGFGNTRLVEISHKEKGVGASAAQDHREYVRRHPANEQARHRREERTRPTRRPEVPYIESYPDSDSTPPPFNMTYQSVPYTTHNGYQGFPIQQQPYQQYSGPYGSYYPPAPTPPQWNGYGPFDPIYAPAVPRYIDPAPRSPIPPDYGSGDALSASSNVSVAGSSTSSVEQENTRLKRQIRKMKQDNQNAKMKEEIRREVIRDLDHEVSRIRRESHRRHSRASNPMHPRTNNIELVKVGHVSRHTSRRDRENMVHDILDVVNDYGYARR